MYTRIALGKNRAMDVVSGESSGGTGQLLFLYPLLFALQILQCWIGALSALLTPFLHQAWKWRTSNEIGIYMGSLFLGMWVLCQEAGNAGGDERDKIPAGACMLSGTFLAVISPEGWLDPEAHESDLRGSRGVAVAGGLLIFMGVANFQNTVRLSLHLATCPCTVHFYCRGGL